MYNEHFHLNQHPFSTSPPPEFIFHSAELREALAHFQFALENREAFLMMTGEVGTGKTTAIQALLRLLPEGTPVAVVSHTTLKPRELLEEICMRFEVPMDGTTTKPVLVRRLEEFFEDQWRAGRQALLILDEAHLLSVEVLEEVRLLSNLEREGGKLVQICLIGQPELVAHLQRNELRQLRQRISVRYSLRPLSREETRDYLEHRLRAAGNPHPNRVFTADGIDVVHQMTGGIPREINVVASQAMLNAFLENRGAVNGRLVASVGQDYGFEGLRTRPSAAGAPAERAVPPPPPITRDLSPSPPQTARPHSIAPPHPIAPPPPVEPRRPIESVPPAEPRPSIEPAELESSRRTASEPAAPEAVAPPRPTPRPIPLPPKHLRPEPVGGFPETEPEEDLLAASGGAGEEPVKLADGPGIAEAWSERSSRREPIVWGVLVGIIVVAALWIWWQGTRTPSLVDEQSSLIDSKALDSVRDAVTAGDEAAVEDAGPAGPANSADESAPGDSDRGGGVEGTQEAGLSVPVGAAGETPTAASRPAVRVLGNPRGVMTAQIASFKSEANARRIQRSISTRLEIPGDVLVADVNGSRWFRICVGRFTSTDQAAAQLRPLIRDGTIREIVLVPLPESWNQ